MDRDPERLEASEFDVLVIGAGAFGACAFDEAASRGLRAALIDKGDFCGSTSANHYKMIHGGVRYMQHLDLPRVRQSSSERSTLLRIAPHLARPVPIVMPTFGRGKRGRAFLRTGLLLYDLLTARRNAGIREPSRRVPWSRSWSRKRLLREFPRLGPLEPTGAAVFFDGQMFNPPRLALGFVRRGVESGGTAANYVEALRFEHGHGGSRRVVVHDRIAGTEFGIRTRAVLNCAGPWAGRLLSGAAGIELRPEPTFSRDLAFVVRRRLHDRYGLAVPMESSDVDALLDRGARHVFLMPWKGRTLVGVWHKVTACDPDALEVTEEELDGYVAEVNRACPGLDLRIEEVEMVNTGLVLFGQRDAQGDSTLSFGKRSRLVDHARDGWPGVFTLLGVRATMARGMAEEAIEALSRSRGRPLPPSRSAQLPLPGGDIADLPALIRRIAARGAGRWDEAICTALAHNHGTGFTSVADLADEEPRLARSLPGSSVLAAEVVHAARHEMAATLADIVLRRTDLATAGHPGDAALRACAKLLAAQPGFDAELVDKQRVELDRMLRSRGPWCGLSRREARS